MLPAMDGFDWTDILTLVMTLVGLVSALCASNGGPPAGGEDSQ